MRTRPPGAGSKERTTTEQRSSHPQHSTPTLQDQGHPSQEPSQARPSQASQRSQRGRARLVRPNQPASARVSSTRLSRASCRRPRATPAVRTRRQERDSHQCDGLLTLLPSVVFGLCVCQLDFVAFPSEALQTYLLTANLVPVIEPSPYSDLPAPLRKHHSHISGVALLYRPTQQLGLGHPADFSPSPSPMLPPPRSCAHSQHFVQPTNRVFEQSCALEQQWVPVCVWGVIPVWREKPTGQSDGDSRGRADGTRGVCCRRQGALGKDRRRRKRGDQGGGGRHRIPLSLSSRRSVHRPPFSRPSAAHPSLMSRPRPGWHLPPTNQAASTQIGTVCFVNRISADQTSCLSSTCRSGPQGGSPIVIAARRYAPTISILGRQAFLEH